MMLIDASLRKYVRFALVLFIVVLVSTICAGAFGPGLLHQGQTVLPVNPKSLNDVLSLAIPGLSLRISIDRTGVR
jgi:hypothetical protein